MADVVTCFAHTLGTDVSQWQTLEAHSEQVARLCRDFASAFGSAEAGALIGRVHDLGKRDPRFQAYLRGEGSGCPHAYAGAKWLDKSIPGGVGRLLAYTVAGHHTGLPNGMDDSPSSLSAHLAQEPLPTGVNPDWLPKHLQSLIPQWWATLSAEEQKAGLHLWLRMLFSSLVDADWLDTEAFMDPQRAVARPQHFDSMEALLERYEAHMHAFGSPTTPVNLLRAEILDAVLAKASSPKGLFSLTVPTGGGKTLASLGFALRHAVRHGLKKILYVIPYTTIIEQTADVFESVLGENNILEHHSAAEWRDQPRSGGREDYGYSPLAKQLATENWADVPVVLCTNVQFFESFYAANTSACRKLHNVANSVIIFDEAQQLPSEYLAPCTELIQSLVRTCGCSAVLCTATQPNLAEVGIPRERLLELAPHPEQLYQQLKRVELTHCKTKKASWEELAQELSREPSVLCVVNTRAGAQALFGALRGLLPEEACFHLSTWMCAQHRRDTLRVIRERLAHHLPTFVVSTSLVEAGVDLDFPVVYREFTRLDSIAQAAGRCNREGRREMGRVVVFEGPDEPPTMLTKDLQATRIIEDLPSAIHTPEAYQTFFAYLYHQRNSLGKEALAKMLHTPVNLRFREFAESFEIIKDKGDTLIFVPYGEGSARIREAIAGGLDWRSLRALRRYSVQLSKQLAEDLSSRLIPLKMFDQSESPFFALAEDSGCYDAKCGIVEGEVSLIY